MLENLRENVPLAPLTTIGIGGPARYFVEARSVDEVRAALVFAKSEDLPLFVLGGGSNLLIADDGFAGLVLQIGLRGITEESLGDIATVRVGAGERWDDFVAYAVENGLAGIECLSGIPGSAGATPIQNVGAYGQEVSETIEGVEVLDRASGLVTSLTSGDCRFAYRSSIFKTEARDRYIVLAVTFRLRRGAPATIRYPELQRQLEERGVTPSDLAGVRESVLAIRRRKGMVVDPADPDSRSDGSFFMNPILSPSEYDAFASRAAEAPHFPTADGSVKLSAAWLIEHAGFHKGFVLGNVGLSSKHTLALINRGGGTAREVRELVTLIQERVRERFGVEIHPEPNFVGAH
ncbi:MAG: UDP-N-acetylmuramate dehydrogenase [Thermoanaerobaculia bacterium]